MIIHTPVPFLLQQNQFHAVLLPCQSLFLHSRFWPRRGQAISDLGLFEWRRQLTYKAAWYDCQIVIADRFFPSSKRCHECGTINSNLTLSDREWVCQECGVIHDRDFASMNLEYVAVSSTETENACGEISSGVVEIPRKTYFVEAGKGQEYGLS